MTDSRPPLRTPLDITDPNPRVSAMLFTYQILHMLDLIGSSPDNLDEVRTWLGSLSPDLDGSVYRQKLLFEYRLRYLEISSFDLVAAVNPDFELGLNYWRRRSAVPIPDTEANREIYRRWRTSAQSRLQMQRQYANLVSVQRRDATQEDLWSLVFNGWLVAVTETQGSYKTDCIFYHIGTRGFSTYSPVFGRRIISEQELNKRFAITSLHAWSRPQF